MHGAGERGVVGSIYVGSHAAEGTGVVIPCRLCTSSWRVVKQMMSVAVVFNVWSFFIGSAAHNDRGVNGSDDGGKDSLTSGWSVAAGLRRSRGNTKPM